jgi:hypothetical protein
MFDFQEIVKNKSNEELLTMVYQFDKWSPEMLAVVEQELTQRNILPTDINARKQQLMAEEEARLSAGKEASLAGQVVGWLFVFGVLGIAIGYDYAFSKIKSKYSPKTYFKYNEGSRKTGRVLFYASIFISIVFLLARIIWS